MASKCISEPVWSQPRSASPSSHNQGLPSASSKSLHHGLQVNLPTHSITVSKCISEFTQSSFSGAPQIALKHLLQPVQIYRVLMSSYIHIQMGIPTEYMSINNCWTISSSYDFQVRQQSSQRQCCFSQTALLWFEVLPAMLSALPGFSPVLPGAPKVLSGARRCSQPYQTHSDGTPVPVIRDPSYSEGRPVCPPRVWYSPDIVASKFTLHILSDTPGGFQSLKEILLM